MFVTRSMTEKVITISQDEGILKARDLMKEKKIRHLPVVEDNGTLIGIVTDRDIRSAMPSNLLDADIQQKIEQVAAMKVADVMTKNPLTLSPLYTIQDALLLIQEKRVGAFPVVDDKGKLLGILSVRDLLRAFTNVLGIGEPGTLIGVLIEEKVGQMKKIVDAVTEENIAVGSILVARYWDDKKRAVFPYLLTNNVVRVKKKMEELGFELIDPMKWYLDRLPKND